jgi:microcystin-dependent protein
MKKYIITAALCLLSLAGKAQQTYNSGAGFSYAAVLHGLQGSLLQNATVTMRASLYSTAGTVLLYREEHSVTTDGQGVARLRVGKGKATSDSPASRYAYVSPSGTGWLRMEVLQKDGQWQEISMRNIAAVPLAESVRYGTYSVAIGIVVAYGGDVVPDGWLECNGQAVNRTDYPDLFAALGNTGTPATFTVPRLNGSPNQFQRGVEDRTVANGARDPAGVRSVLSTQATALKAHTHTYTDQSPTIDIDLDDFVNIEDKCTSQYYELNKTAAAGSSNGSWPKNAMVKFIIKAKL